METVEMKIEIFDAEFFTNESKNLIKIQAKSNFILKIGDKHFFREISNTISIQHSNNSDLMNLLLENGVISEIAFIQKK
jgi:hypothetical protein